MYEANDSYTGCRECHSSTPVETALFVPFEDNHNGINGASGGYGTNHWGPAHCKVCHTSRLDPPQEWSIDFSQINCTAACHTPPHGAGCLPGSQTDC